MLIGKNNTFAPKCSIDIKACLFALFCCLFALFLSIKKILICTMIPCLNRTIFSAIKETKLPYLSAQNL